MIIRKFFAFLGNFFCYVENFFFVRVELNFGFACTLNQ